MNASIESQKLNWKDLVSIGCQNDQLFPNFSILCHICKFMKYFIQKLVDKILLIIVNCFNAQNATVERGFSLMNRICTKNRNRIRPAVLDMYVDASSLIYNKLQYF